MSSFHFRVDGCFNGSAPVQRAAVEGKFQVRSAISGTTLNMLMYGLSVRAGETLVKGKQANPIRVKYDGGIKMLVHIKGMGYKSAHNLQKGSTDE